MSFSRDIKKEILDNGFEDKQTGLSFLCGLIYSSAEYEVEESKVKNFVIPTDIEFLAEGIKSVLKRLYNREDVEIKDTFKISRREYFNVSIPSALNNSINPIFSFLFNFIFFIFVYSFY